MDKVQKKLLLISQGWVHPNWFARRELAKLLYDGGNYLLHVINSLEKLPAMDLEDYPALVLYFHHKTISPQALDSLDGYLSKGGGCLALHAASASFKDTPAYLKLLGGSFRTHGPVESFHVEPTMQADPIFESIKPFDLHDERYLHDYEEDVVVHFTSSAGDAPEPFVWTRRHGYGRVCYCAAGHTTSSMRSPSVGRIILDGLRWCMGEGT